MPDWLEYVLGAANWALTVVVLLKGRGWLALTAAVASVVPVAGLPLALLVNGFGAVRLGLPDSHWARARYSPVEVRRARTRHPEAPTEPKEQYPALIALAVIVYGLAVAAAAFT